MGPLCVKHSALTQESELFFKKGTQSISHDLHWGGVGAAQFSFLTLRYKLNTDRLLAKCSNPTQHETFFKKTIVQFLHFMCAGQRFPRKLI